MKKILVGYIKENKEPVHKCEVGVTKFYLSAVTGRSTVNGTLRVDEIVFTDAPIAQW